jgi:cytochrome c
MAFCLVGAVVAIAQQSRYNIGKPASAQEIGARNISVAPDGTGLPPGHGTAAQGRAVYRTKCGSCHGERGEGQGDFPALVGGRGSLASDKPFLTVGSYWPFAPTVWDYIHRAMPYQKPGSLTADEVYSITAYVLFMNHIVGQRDDMNAKTLPKVEMPNQDGFILDPRLDLK